LQRANIAIAILQTNTELARNHPVNIAMWKYLSALTFRHNQVSDPFTQTAKFQWRCVTRVGIMVMLGGACLNQGSGHIFGERLETA